MDGGFAVRPHREIDQDQEPLSAGSQRFRLAIPPAVDPLDLVVTPVHVRAGLDVLLLTDAVTGSPTRRLPAEFLVMNVRAVQREPMAAMPAFPARNSKFLPIFLLHMRTPWFWRGRKIGRIRAGGKKEQESGNRARPGWFVGENGQGTAAGGVFVAPAAFAGRSRMGDPACFNSPK